MANKFTPSPDYDGSVSGHGSCYENEKPTLPDQSGVIEINRKGYQLTPREMEVARALAYGLPNRKIAAELGISIKTVDTHRAHVLRKLAVRNNVQLARLAIRRGWVIL